MKIVVRRSRRSTSRYKRNADWCKT